jgi:hypothetical protein
MKKFLLTVISISLSLSVRVYAEDCAVYFKNENVVVIKDTSTERGFASLAMGGAGALGYLLIDSVVKSGDLKTPTPSKNPKHLQLAKFLQEKTVSTPPLDLSKFNMKYLNDRNFEDKCAYKIISLYNIMDNYDNSNAQIFKIQRINSGVVDIEKFIRVSSNMKISLLQRKPRKELKEIGSGKYIDISKKMIDENVYNEMVFDKFLLSNDQNIEQIIKKYKDIESK